MALIQTNPKRRRYGVAALAGVLGGIVSAIVKFGWEVPLPPRTPERNATNSSSSWACPRASRT